MEVDHGRLDAGVAHQILDGPDVGAVLEQLRGKGMPQRLNTLLTNSDW
jgi:hypothetical protein